MSTVQDVTNTTATSSTASSSSTQSSNSVLGKDDFLKLLVTQLQNQDPLSPDDPTQFTAQLAQFSSLEQLNNLNTSMSNVVTATNNATKLSALDMIGKEISFTGSGFTYSGSPVQLGYTLDGAASQVQMIIQDSNGKTLQVLNGKELTKGNHLITWDGKDQFGNTVPSGSYKVVIQAKGVDSSGVAASPFVKSEVTGVDLSGTSNAILNTNAGDIDFSKVIGVYPNGNS